jgi:ketosteroid isomerase-like protein
VAAVPADAEVLSTFDALLEALTERRDGAAGTSLFAGDDDVVMSGSEEGERAVGPAAVAALHRSIAASPARLAFAWRERSVHLEGDVAWVDAAGEVRVERDGAAPLTLPYRVTAVLVRRDGAWRWHTFHGSQPHSTSS